MNPGCCQNGENFDGSSSENQSFFLNKNFIGRVLNIAPHSNLTLPLLFFKPNKFNQSSMTLYIKNNLSYLSTIRLKGTGGKGNLIISEIRAIVERNGTRFFSTVRMQ